MLLNALVSTRSRFGSVAVPLNLATHRNSPARSTKSTTSHSCGALSACKHTVSGSFSLPSRGSFHLSLTVLFAIGHVVVFSLLGWSPFLPSGFLVSRRTPDPTRVFKISSTGVSPSLQYLSRYFDYPSDCYLVVLTPTTLRRWFGLLRFRSPLLSESLLFSFPPGT